MTEFYILIITDNESDELVTNCDRFEMLKHSSVNPYAFTEQGVLLPLVSERGVNGLAFATLRDKLVNV